MTALTRIRTHTVDSMKGIGGERRRGGVHTKPTSPVLVCPTRGSVVEVHESNTQQDDPHYSHYYHHLHVLPPVLVF